MFPVVTEGRGGGHQIFGDQGIDSMAKWWEGQRDDAGWMVEYYGIVGACGIYTVDVWRRGRLVGCYGGHIVAWLLSTH